MDTGRKVMDNRAPFVGQRVSTNLEHAWVYAGTEKEGKASIPRTGTIVEVPWAASHTGNGTVRVRWDSLTDAPNSDNKRWLMWHHTSLITLHWPEEQNADRS